MKQRVTSLFSWYRFSFIGSTMLLVIGLLFLSLVLTSKITHASTWGGDAARYGYFNTSHADDSNTPYPGALGPVVTNNEYTTNAIPTSVNSVTKLFEYLQDKYNHTGTYGTQNTLGIVPASRALQWDRTGISFIVNTMLGRQAGTGHKTLTAADWTDLQARLNYIATNGSVKFDTSVNTATYGNINTFYQYNSDDVSWYKLAAAETKEGISFSYGGKNVYALFYVCANPLGNLGGLPAAPSAKFNLTPSVGGSVANGSGTEAGAKVTVNPTVANSSGSTVTSAVKWQESTFTIAPKANGTSGTIPAGGTGTANPNTHYGNGATTVASGSRTFPKGSSNTAVGANTPTISSTLPVGTLVCYALSVAPYNQTVSTSTWRYSTPYCLVIGKLPKIQILGGDLAVNGGISTSTSNIVSGTTTKVFGSWVEYGVFSTLQNGLGNISPIASASGLSGGNTSTIPKDWSKLTFSNTTATKYGVFSSTLPSAADVTDQFSGSGATGTAPADGNLSGVAGTAGLNVYDVGNYTINASTIGRGVSIIINSTGTVTVNGNVNYYPGPYTSTTQLPQLVIIAKNINVVSSVTNIDAWLDASGTINDCSDVTGNLSSLVCNKQLTVNGPVITATLKLRRTAGSDSAATADSPAEVFNLRADAYLWSYNEASLNGKAQTIFTTELPPRF